MAKFLFICSANECRSRTAEIYFQFHYKRSHLFRSAGINNYSCKKHGGTILQQYMLDVSDWIICAEQVHSDFIVKHFDKKYLSKIHVLNLGDTENFMSEQLIELLEQKFNPNEEKYRKI